MCVYSMYTYSKYAFGQESRPNYGLRGTDNKMNPLLFSHTHTHTHTHTHICFIHIATSTAVYTPSVLSPGWFWHRHRNQKTSHISNANCPSGQKWSTSVEYHSEFQTKEQLGEEQLRNAGHKHVFEYKFDWWRRFLFEWVRPGDLCFVPICPPVKRLAQSKGKIVFLKRQVSVANCVKKKKKKKDNCKQQEQRSCRRTRSLPHQRKEFQKNMVKSEAFCHMAIHSFSVCRQRGD